jgi:NADPH-dependent 2,4-dienoyl-CoA reductase/sulfur reductase-like enzyme
MGAAVSAAESGRRVGVVDDNPCLGGQIWRSGNTDPSSPAAEWVEKLRTAGVEVLHETRVFHSLGTGTLLAENADEFCELGYDKLILATGARERFLPFSGWTLPNVMGAGGLQAMVKSGLPIKGKRVLIAGTGPLLLAVAAYLRKNGAEIPFICEQASSSSVVRFATWLMRQPNKLGQAISLGKDISGVPLVCNSWPVAALGQKTLEAVVISKNHKTGTVPCDYLACSFHLVPNTELAALLGCRLRTNYVQVDDLQQTSVPEIFCAGEPTGIGGVGASLLEGKIAGYVASGHQEKARAFLRERNKQRQFASALERTFRLRPELKSLAKCDTIVCRCEDVTYGRLQSETSWRAGKLHARCGMGPCQGRICGPATEFLFNWRPESVRPPVFPVRFASLAAMSNRSARELNEVPGGTR